MFKTKVFFNGTKTEVQTSRFEFPNPRVLDFLQQQNLLRADNEEYIVCPTTREKRPVFFLFNGMSSDEQLRERLSGFNAADLSADDTAQLMETWQRGAREMFHSPELVSFRGAVCEQPTEARFIDVNIDINVDATKELSVMPTISSELSTTNQHLYIDFAIITAIEVERKAVCKAFGIGDDRRVKTESGIYWRGTLDDFYEIVIVQCRDQANIDMALTTLRTLDEWTPGAALMVGIAAAAREDKPRLGDVVVASSIYYYERGKMTPEGKKPEPQMYPSDSYLWANVETLPDWGSQILVQRPNGSGERPEIHRGVVASGEKVIADAAVRDEIAAAHRKIMAIEMEGYGFSKAVWDRFNPVRHLVIRGIVDKASNEKDDQWHSYAAAAAASYAKHFLIDRPLPPRNRSRQRICYYGICSQP
jgi:nucleoside phosphorylase